MGLVVNCLLCELAVIDLRTAAEVVRISSIYPDPFHVHSNRAHEMVTSDERIPQFQAMRLPYHTEQVAALVGDSQVVPQNNNSIILLGTLLWQDTIEYPQTDIMSADASFPVKLSRLLLCYLSVVTQWCLFKAVCPSNG